MEIYLLFFTALQFVLLLCTSSEVHNNFTDLSALLAFKASIHDPHRILATNWTTDASLCTWTGVSCDSRGQRVVALDIVSLPLYGTIAPHIANLSFLSYLNLTDNGLTGPIPDSLSQLPRLKSLILAQNQLSGSLPANIFNMSRLTQLYLQNNNLSGTLPSNHSLHQMLPRVHNLSVASNQFSGNIPSSLSYCHHLRRLGLSYNSFNGNIPSELGNLRELRILYLGANNLTGTIPSSLGNLTNLLKLEFGFNNIYGIIPKEFGGLSNLHMLIADGNYISGPIPTSLSNVSTLEVLDLTSNLLSGPVQLHFGNMPHLRTLFLDGNMLTGGLDFLSSLSNCRDLTFLEFGGNKLDGFLPNTVGNLSTELVKFVFALNKIKGKIPAEFGNLTSLWEIDLGYNELVGKIPSEIITLEGLQSLHLENNRLSGPVPSEIGRLGSLYELFLSRNNLSGPIPDSLGNISGLQNLGLSGNALSSGIPESVWSLTGLIELYLSQNFLDGLLSSRMENVKSLLKFDVSMNRLSGNIPNALKELQMLTYLDLSNNSFDGYIPQAFGELMMNLEVLNLSCNNLSGPIPNSLANLKHINSINLSFNKLEGQIPNTGVFLNLSIVSLIGNPALCGEPKLGFPPCPTNARISNSWTSVLLKIILPITLSITILGACGYMLNSRCKETKNFSPINPPSLDNYRMISYRELVLATENFSNANLLGSGGFSSVYKGCLDDGLLVAIKVLNLKNGGALRSFDVECHALSMVRHRNLVKIITTCSNLDFKALVLQFLPNGSLERWLYSENYHLDLLQRINIILDVASALEYLHHYHFHVIVHCDLKPSNVLLDEDMTALVGDFGIARVLLGDSVTVVSTSVLGTIGYMAPEYASSTRVSRKGDVYSFGILLLEIFTGKSPTDPVFTGELNLRKWVCEALPNALLEIVDSSLLNDGSGNKKSSKDLIFMHESLYSILELGILCSRDSPKKRPPIIEIVPILQKIKTDFLFKFPKA